MAIVKRVLGLGETIIDAGEDLIKRSTSVSAKGTEMLDLTLNMGLNQVVVAEDASTTLTEMRLDRNAAVKALLALRKARASSEEIASAKSLIAEINQDIAETDAMFE